MKIRSLTLAVATLPAFLVTVLLIAYWATERLAETRAQLAQSGSAYTATVAAFSELALTFGVPAYVDPQIDELMGHDDIIGIEIFDASNRLFASRYRDAFHQLKKKDAAFIFNRAILHPSYNNQIFDPSNTVSVAPSQTVLSGSRHLLGNVVVYLSHDILGRDEQRVVATWLVLGVFAVLISAIAGRMVSGFIARPVQQITTIVSDIRSGKYNSDVPGTNRIEEFQQLVSGISLLQTELDNAEQRNDTYVKQLVDARENAERLVEQRTAELKSARDNAIDASRAKDEFLATISHEFRTPLQSILGYLKLLRTDLPMTSSSVNEDLDYLEIASRDLLTLTEGILDFKRIESGHIDLEFTSAVVPDFIRDTCGTIIPLASSYKIQVLPSVSPGVGEFIADFGRLRQVLLNLLTNAVKHSSTAVIHLVVDILPPNGDLRIRVIDEGCGISKTHLSMIFNPFTQLRRQADISVRGVGLGLSISRRLVELMGGTIEVDSTLGNGTCFSVIVPKRTNEPTEHTPARELICYEHASLRILIGEDDTIISRLLVRLLSAHGHHVRVENDGRRTLEVLQREPFDLCIVDYNMPRMSGLEVAKRYRFYKSQDSVHFPFIVLTADGSQQTVAAITKAGLPMLVKPVTEEVLLHAIHQTVNGRSPRASVVEVTEPDVASPPIIHISCFNEVVSIGGKDFALETYRDFVSNVNAFLDKLPTLAEDQEALRAMVHRLRGSGSTLGLYRLLHNFRISVYQDLGVERFIARVSSEIKDIDLAIENLKTTFIDRQDIAEAL